MSYVFVFVSVSAFLQKLTNYQKKKKLENQKYVMDQNVQYFEYIIFSAQSVGIDIF
jgi:hypothetical protein